jgi:hypothetical protein
MFSARCRAHSRRFCVGVQSRALVWAADEGVSPMLISTSVCGCVRPDILVALISMSAGRDCARSGALKTRRPPIAPFMRLPNEPKAPGKRRVFSAELAAAGCELAEWPPRERMRVMYRSRRTMTLVTLTGIAPGGRTLCLHKGHSEELLSRKVSMHSGWKMWRQGSSRTCVWFGSKSSMQMGHVGWDHTGTAPAAPVDAVGTEPWRTRGDAEWPVSASTVGKGRLAAGLGT